MEPSPQMHALSTGAMEPSDLIPIVERIPAYELVGRSRLMYGLFVSE